MQNITLCYSTPRPETLALTTRIMKNHDVILLEEPLHPDFYKALGGAQALIYSKIIIKEEISSADGEFPHTRNEIRSIAAVKKLSIEKCRTLFQRIRSITSIEAAEMTEKYLKMTRG